MPARKFKLIRLKWPLAMIVTMLDGCALCLVFRAIALTLRAGLRSQPLTEEDL